MYSRLKSLRILSILLVIFISIGMGLDVHSQVISSEIASVMESELMTAYASVDSDEKLEVRLTLADNLKRENTITLEEAIKTIETSESTPEIYDIRALVKESTLELDTGMTQKLIMAQRETYKKFYSSYNAKYVDMYLKNYDIVHVSQYMPAVTLNLSKAQAQKIARNPNVVSLSLAADSTESNPADRVESIKSPINESYTDMYFQAVKSANSSYLSAQHITEVMNAGYTGNNVKIGIIDQMPIVSYYQSTLGISDSYTPVASATQTGHPTNIAAILKHVAPNSELYLAIGRDTQSLESSLEWLNNKGVNIVNISMSTSTSEYSIVSKLLDYYSYYLCMTFVVSSGNSSADSPVDQVSEFQSSYNAIVVGNVDIYGTRFSSSRYSLNSNTNIPYRPDIMGIGVDINSLYHRPESHSVHGTSYSAPFVAGSLALLMESNSSLMLSPELCKAVLTASARGTSDSSQPNTPSSTDYQEYGAGMLDCYAAYSILQSNKWDFSSLSLDNPSDSIKVALSNGKKVTISLAFLRKSDGKDDTTSKPADLDIYLLTLDSSSTTKSNNVEILTVTITSTREYTLFIRDYAHWSHDIYYGYAIYER